MPNATTKPSLLRAALPACWVVTMLALIYLLLRPAGDDAAGAALSHPLTAAGVAMMGLGMVRHTHRPEDAQSQS